MESPALKRPERSSTPLSLLWLFPWKLQLFDDDATSIGAKNPHSRSEDVIANCLPAQSNPLGQPNLCGLNLRGVML